MFLSKVKHKNLIPGAIALSVFLLSGCGEEAASQVAAAAVPVDVAIVSTMDVPVTSRLTGRADPVRKAEVRPQVSGIILKRLFTEGSIVEEGQQLYQIDPALYEAAVDSAKAQLESANATLTSTSLRYERYKKLLKSNAISKQDYDDSEAAYLQAKASVNSAKAQLKTAEINLAYTKVYAPISGRIGKSDFTEGALVSAQQTNPLATIQQLDPMYVDFGQSVEQHLALRRAVKDGSFKLVDGKAPLDIYFSDGSKYNLQGQLEFSDITVDETTGMVNLRTILPNPDQVILPGMFIRGDINEGYIPDAIVIRKDAVIREAAGETYVYTITSENKAQRTVVKVGTEYQDIFVITDGLKPGDKVITSNIQKIRTGTEVSEIDNSQKAEKKNNQY
ncbi:efflux RND transporter periplasmic adaptor subunit [Succinatimonas hippei]|uniref:efflux RND transporter periplasmic adaptor subunit n=1 Tax=Succinatimonas hippei TaxID=626938 RepID=UPI0023F9F96B|nr:efflux RND transporter periplasmic adaptor subunit [Succinatimonas hippei]